MLIHGSPTFEFQCFKGMRKGDPLSPYLFLVVMEALSNMVSSAEEVGIIKGFQTPNRGPIVSRLLYADDAMFIREWTKRNVENVNRLLRWLHLC